MGLEEALDAVHYITYLVDSAYVCGEVLITVQSSYRCRIYLLLIRKARSANTKLSCSVVEDIEEDVVNCLYEAY